MNGIEKLTQQISADAQAEVDKILAEAQAKADAIAADYAKQVEALAVEAQTKATDAAKQREERLASMGDLAARKELLAVKQEMLDKAFQRALEMLCDMSDKEYTELLTKLVLQCAKGHEQLIFSQKDRTRVGKAVATAANEALGDGKLTLSEQTRPIRGGFILSDGDVEVNCAFETLVRLMRGEISGEVAGVLFA